MKNKSVRLIILNKDKEILLIKRICTETREPLKLILPGGRVEEGESNFFALEREISEELDITIKQSKTLYLGYARKSSYDDMIINFYFYNKLISLNSICTSNEEVENINYYNLLKINKNKIAFNEYTLLMEYYQKALGLHKNL